MIAREEVYKIGRIGKPHGVKGEVSLQFTDDVFDRADTDFLVLDIDGILVPFFFEEYRFRSESVVLVKFCDVDTQEQARELTGREVFFMRKFADVESDSISWTQIVGFKLTDAGNGNDVGTITNVDETTMNILFEVLTSEGKEILVPASEELIESINSETREVRLAIPDGILEL